MEAQQHGESIRLKFQFQEEKTNLDSVIIDFHQRPNTKEKQTKRARANLKTRKWSTTTTRVRMKVDTFEQFADGSQSEIKLHSCRHWSELSSEVLRAWRVPPLNERPMRKCVAPFSLKTSFLFSVFFCVSLFRQRLYFRLFGDSILLEKWAISIYQIGISIDSHSRNACQFHPLNIMFYISLILSVIHKFSFFVTF